MSVGAEENGMAELDSSKDGGNGNSAMASKAPPSPKPVPSMPSTRDVYRLTDSEIASLREKFRKSGEWAKQQLAIDPELKHLGPAGG
jgi:hypothetical protein